LRKSDFSLSIVEIDQIIPQNIEDMIAVKNTIPNTSSLDMALLHKVVNGYPFIGSPKTCGPIMGLNNSFTN
jgi:hypothetical protein